MLRYVKGTVEKGLVYGGASSGCDEASVIKGFVDSDYAGCLDTRKSLTGFIFTAYWTTISWKAGLQKVMALSTMEAEYMALTEVVKKALWLLGLVFELNDAKQRFIRVFCDNQSALQLTKNQVFHERIKHIDVKLHFIKDILAKGSVKVAKIPTEENPSDMITKPLPSRNFLHCLELIRMKSSRT